MGGSTKRVEAKKWAHDYFGRRRFNLSDVLAERIPRPEALPGLPNDFPLPLVTAEGSWANRDEFLQAMEDACRKGYGSALYEYLYWHLILDPNEPLPRFAAQELGAALSRWRAYDTTTPSFPSKKSRAITLDDAIGAKRPRSKARERQFRYYFRWTIFLAIQSAHRDGVVIDKKLFAVIGERFAVSASTVGEIYGECKANPGIDA
jgi:hypothetical protein